METEKALEQYTPPGELAVPEPTNMLAVIARAAADPRVDVEKMRALVDLQLRIETRQAEVEFNAALARLMPKLPRIEKDGIIFNKDGKTIRSRYARYEDIDAAIRPLLGEEGLAITFDTEEIPPKSLKVIGTISHRMGHSRKSQIILPLDSPVIAGAQLVGSVISFGKRYLVTNLLNIVTVGADSDAQPVEYITEDQVLQLETLLHETGADYQRFLVWAGVNKLAEIEKRKYQAVLQALMAKARKEGKG